MKKALRVFLGIVFFLVVAGGVLFFVMNKSLPEGQEGPEAERLADKMLTAVNAEAWEEVKFIEWDFPRGHHLFWDRERHLGEVKWDGYRVLVDPNTLRGIAYSGTEKLTGEEQQAKVDKAMQLFWNDSFWLMGFLKVRDPGTTRKLVITEEGEEALLVTYATGGVTPGDSYLWLLDPSGRPRAWQMWVNIVPIGGAEFTWEDWYALPNGAMVAPTHANPLFNVDLLDIKIGNSLSEMGRSTDIFAELINN
ncbi:MAG: hypothetical protein AAGN35_17545 [Bacteroidota bacterium]